MTPDRTPTIGDLYPGFDEHTLREAEANLTRYVQLAFRVHNRLRAQDAEERSTAPLLTGSEGSLR